MDRLPSVIKQEIFSYFDLATEKNAALVSKQWNYEICCMVFPTLYSFKAPGGQKALTYQLILSKKELIKKVENFIDKMRFGQIGEWKCFFPYQSTLMIDLKLGLTRNLVKNAHNLDFKETYFFVTELETSDCRSVTVNGNESDLFFSYNIIFPKPENFDKQEVALDRGIHYKLINKANKKTCQIL